MNSASNHEALIKQAATDALRAMIWLYRHSLSALLGRHCRFTPTCSAYADEAIRIHGPARGTQLAFKRLCRCHPFTFLGGGNGYDPVPEKGVRDQGSGAGV